jgi:hypothetical protein
MSTGGKQNAGQKKIHCYDKSVVLSFIYNPTTTTTPTSFFATAPISGGTTGRTARLSINGPFGFLPQLHGYKATRTMPD